MPHSSRPAVQWDALIDDYLTSELSQRAFCEERGVPFHGFSHRYQRSEKFAGKRRQKKKNAKTGGFVAVRSRPTDRSAPAVPTSAETTLIRIGTDIAVECPAAIAIDAIARLALDARR